MSTHDVDSLFTNVSLDKTIEICVSEFSQPSSGLSKQQFLEMLLLTTKGNLYLIKNITVKLME